MSVRRLLPLLTVLALAPLGCGSEREPAAAASLAPAGARALVEVDGDLDSDQWQAARELVSRFPDGERLLTKLEEVDAAAGDSIVVVALGGGERDVVGLTQPDDSSKLEQLLREHELVSRELGGWTAAAETAAVLDRYEAALEQGTLAGDDRYEQSRATLPDDALATAYVRGEGSFDWLAFALTAEDDAFRLAGRLEGAPAEARPAAASLLEEVPADAFAAVVFGGGELPAELPNLLGIDLRPVAELLAGGGVAWARPGFPLPEITAVLPNGDAARVEELLRALTGAEPEDATLDGRPARRIQADPLTLTYAEIDGRLVLTSGTSPGGSGRLVDEPAFQEALQAAGAPERPRGLLYLDVRAVGPLLGFLGDDELGRNLARVDSVIGFSAGDGDEREVGLLVRLR